MVTSSWNTLFIFAFLLPLVVRGDVFSVPMPFLTKFSSSSISRSHPQLWAAADIVHDIRRGGSDSVYEEEDDDETAEVVGEEEEYDEDVEEEYDAEEGAEDVILTDFPGEEEDEDAFVPVVEEQVEEIFDDEEEEEEVLEDAKENEIIQEALEDTEEEPEPSLTQRFVEERMATTTDDENSSAFVDRMELADAYDEGETTAGGDAVELAAVTAATAVGGSDEEQATQHPITEITNEMKTILRKELKYIAHEVKNMRPDIAAMIVGKGLRRPREGMPPNFYVEGSKPMGGLRKNAFKISLALTVVGVAAIVGLKGGDAELELESMQDALKKLPAVLAAALTSKGGGNAAKKEVSPAVVSTATTPASSQESDEAAEAESAVEKEDDDEDRPRSVKPYSDHPPHYEDDLDKTWLDKGITKIENAMKAFFRIKI